MTQCARATTTITTTQRNKTVGLNFLFFFSADGQWNIDGKLESTLLQLTLNKAADDKIVYASADANS